MLPEIKDPRYFLTHLYKYLKFLVFFIFWSNQPRLSESPPYFRVKPVKNLLQRHYSTRVLCSLQKIDLAVFCPYKSLFIILYYFGSQPYLVNFFNLKKLAEITLEFSMCLIYCIGVFIGVFSCMAAF